jgi:glycosyltransferase involved in cell wall biosynthesis
VLESVGSLRYLRATLRTIRVLWARQPALLFVQNPSILLAAIAVLYGKIFGRTIVVDRHSNFPELPQHPLWQGTKRQGWKKWLFQALSGYSLRGAALTIVTNDHVAALVRDLGGIPVVLPDPIPSLVPTTKPRLEGRFSVFVVSSFAEDEPVAEVMGAARALDEAGVVVYFSGNPKRAGKDWTAGAPRNVRFTGFLPRQEYINTLYASDAISVLTTIPHCLLCGCYEATAAGKPLLTSDTAALKAHFREAVFAGPTAEAIENGVRTIMRDPALRAEQTECMRARLVAEWQAAFVALKAAVALAVHDRTPGPRGRRPQVPVAPLQGSSASKGHLHGPTRRPDPPQVAR